MTKHDLRGLTRRQLLSRGMAAGTLAIAGAGFIAGTFKVTLKGWPPVGLTTVAAKGPDVAFGQIKGPDCPGQ